MSAMDTFFISHGAPPMVTEDSIRHSFLQSWQSSIMKERPKAILMIGAHWDTEVSTVNLVHGANDTIYDFDGLPREMHRYEVRNKYSCNQQFLVFGLTCNRNSNLLSHFSIIYLIEKNYL